MRKLILTLWLVLFSVLAIPVCFFAVIFIGEGLASLARHPGNAIVVALSMLFLFGWPILAIAGFIALARGKPRTALLVTGIPAGALPLLWMLALLVRAVF